MTKYKYTVYKEVDNEKFKETCKKIIHGVDNLIANEPIIDVDGSTIQKYISPNSDIKVSNDYELMPFTLILK